MAMLGAQDQFASHHLKRKYKSPGMRFDVHVWELQELFASRDFTTEATPSEGFGLRINKSPHNACREGSFRQRNGTLSDYLFFWKTTSGVIEIEREIRGSVECGGGVPLVASNMFGVTMSMRIVLLAAVVLDYTKAGKDGRVWHFIYLTFPARSFCGGEVTCMLCLQRNSRLMAVKIIVAINLKESQVKAKTMDKAIRKRASVKSILTVFSKFVESLQAKDEVSSSNLRELDRRLNRSQNLIEAFNEVQTEIESLCEDVNEEFCEREDFENKFELVIGLATDILERHNYYSDKNSDANSVHSANSSKLCAGIKPSIVLPQIDLPKFNGAPEDWLEYRATFENLIHSNDSLNDLQKFHYLKASLGGIAAQLVKPTPFIAENYSIAWSALCDEYDNSKVLIHEHVRSLFQLSSIHRENAAELKTLVNQVSQHLTCLEMLGESRQNLGNLLLTYLIKTKLDTSTAQEWEKYVSKKQRKSQQVVGARVNSNDQKGSLSWEDMKEFLKERASLLRTTEVDCNTDSKGKFKDKKRMSKSFVSNTGDSFVATKSAFSCNYCKQGHSIYSCKAFSKLKAEDRVDFVRQSNLCKVCLLGGHTSRNCKHGPCRKCRKFHNSLLHEAFYTPKKVEPEVSASEEGELSESSQNLSANLTSLSVSGTQVLLSTASVWIKSNDKQMVKARVLLDSGSQASFVTSSLCEKLGIKGRKSELSIFGINNVKALSEQECSIEVKARTSDFTAKVNCYVLPEITSYTPSFPIRITDLKIPDEIVLADPEFHIPGPVDVLIGGELFWDLIRDGKIALGLNKPVLTETALGWVVAGQVECRQPRLVKANVCISVELSKQVQRFWEIEEVDNAKPLSDEEKYCERHFKENTRRDVSGKFIVSMPLKQSAETLGKSYNQALQRFSGLERKFKRNPQLYDYYCQFMREYKDMGHMSLVPRQVLEKEDSSIPTYYMPHHAVIKAESKTTRLRVVFDASASSSSGLSLNDIQIIGPMIQEELFSIILRFRKHNIVMAADIAKMYRMVLMNPEHRKLQRIIWRENALDEIQVYELSTVTYGQASSSYLATRCLIEIASRCEKTFPQVSDVIRSDFYVDDMLTGAGSLEQAKILANDISSVLEQYGFMLRKWQSNHPDIADVVGDKTIEHSVVQIEDAKTTKILGLTWSGCNDKLLYTVHKEQMCSRNTKRSILSSIAKIFDPLGLLAPCVSLAKMIMQSLWVEKCDWDEEAPECVKRVWEKYNGELSYLEDLAIPRQVICDSNAEMTLVGFADASEKAYGACIYIVSEFNDHRHTNLLCAKSKLAPIKKLTTPRLELLAALY
nr:unnamed protein product [Callosobruchus analis]